MGPGMRVVAVILFVLGPFLTPAFAQAPGETAIVPVPAPVADEGTKDPTTAVLLSVGVTAGGALSMYMGGKKDNDAAVYLGLGAVWIGPSVGRWYAGNVTLSGLGVRAIGALAMIVGLAMSIGDDCDGCSGNSNAGPVLLIGGLGTWGVSSIYDILMAGHDANEWNAQHARTNLQLRPMIMTVADHHVGGLVLSGRF
jgi:hypothetical protein